MPDTDGQGSKGFRNRFLVYSHGYFLFAALIDTPESILKYFLTIFAVEVLVFFIGFMLYKVYGHRGVITYAIASTFCTIGLILWTVLSVA